MLFIYLLSWLDGTVMSRHPAWFSVSSHSCLEHPHGTGQKQGGYKFNQANFQEIPGGISRKIQDVFA